MGSILILLWRDPSVQAAAAIIIGRQLVAGAVTPIERLRECGRGKTECRNSGSRDELWFGQHSFSPGSKRWCYTSGVGPAWEFNYGLIPNGQFHVVAPLAFDLPAGASDQFGYGDTEIGFKYRFIQEDKNGWTPMVGIFPMLEVPTGDQNRGLGAGHVRLFLPIWLQKSFGDWTTYGGGGYWINQNNWFGDKNFWFFGWLLQRKVTEKLVIGGEIFHQTADTIGGKDSTGFNLGAIYDFDEHNHLLVSAGTGIQNASSTNLYSWYLGYQITN
jgi:hypothetical protein